MTEYPRDAISGSQAARLIGISAEQVRWCAEHGRIGSYWTPHGRVYSKREIEEFARKREQSRANG